jgi:adenosine/AMP kinase
MAAFAYLIGVTAEVTDVTEISRITCAAGNTIGLAVADTAMDSNK